MQPFTTLTGVTAPLLRDDINTDQICPVLPLRLLDPDYAAQLFVRLRKRPDGSDNPDFVLNQPQYRSARILVTGRNFGCGSARESAAWAIAAFGIRCIVARSFAELFRNNAIRNGILPIVLPDAAMETFEAKVAAAAGAQPFAVDLAVQHIVCPDGTPIAFTIDNADRAALLQGLDEIGLTLQNAADIAAFEQRCRATQPWLQSLEQSPTARQ
jgi:3-isopropylmalate/(R)-2-methylmalate dehydratase small subunit